MIENKPDEIETPTVFVVSVLRYRENLIVRFQRQVEFRFEPRFDVREKFSENLFRGCKERPVVGI